MLLEITIIISNLSKITERLQIIFSKIVEMEAMIQRVDKHLTTCIYELVGIIHNNSAKL